MANSSCTSTARRPRPTRHATCRDNREDVQRYTRGLQEQVAYLRAQVEHLRGQIEREQEVRTEERRRHDTVIAQLSRANEEQARTIREIEAPQETTEAPETVAEEASDRAEPQSTTGGAQEGAQRRPWWKRVFRG
jgi:TolA-binding protein